jgi:hypothetical protein
MAFHVFALLLAGKFKSTLSVSLQGVSFNGEPWEAKGL